MCKCLSKGQDGIQVFFRPLMQYIFFSFLGFIRSVFSSFGLYTTQNHGEPEILCNDAELSWYGK